MALLLVLNLIVARKRGFEVSRGCYNFSWFYLIPLLTSLLKVRNICILVNSIFSSGAPLTPMSNEMGSPVDPDQFSQPTALSREMIPVSLGAGMNFHPVPRCWWNCQLITVRLTTSTAWRERGREGGRKGGREGGREGGMKGGRQGWREGWEWLRKCDHLP